MSLDVTEDFEWDRPKDGEQPDFIVVDKHRPPESEPDEQLRGNPMAMVFPPPLSDERLGKELRKLKLRPYPSGWEQRTLAARLELLVQIRNFHFVFLDDILTANKCLSVVRNTYRYRDPRNPRVMRAIMELMEGCPSAVTRLNQEGGGGGLGMLLTGPSGLGKSSMKDRIVKHIGGYGRLHQSLNGRPVRWPQLGVIAVNVAKTWSLTLQQIIDEADRQRGIQLRPYRTDSSRGELQRLVQLALTSGFCPLLILDEIQNLAQLTPRLAKEILDGAINLMEMFGIPVLLIGTVRVRALFQRHDAEMGKFALGGTIEVKALKLGNPETTEFINAMKRYAVSLSPIHYSEDFEQQLLAQTMGVRRFMAEYMFCVFARHAEDESIVANGALLESIAVEELKDLQDALSVLRMEALGMRLKPSDYDRYEDRLAEADLRRQQLAAEVRTQAEWYVRTKERRTDRMSATDFLATQVRKRQVELELAAEAAEAAKANANGAVASEAEAPVPKRGRGRPRKNVQSPLKKAQADLNQSTKVVSLAAHRPADPSGREGLDGSEIS